MKFEFKKEVLFVFEKEKKKRKENLTFFSARPAHRPIYPSPQRPTSPLPFSFSSVLPTRWPHLSAPHSPSSRLPFLSSALSAPTGTPAAPAHLPSPSFPSLSRDIWKLIPAPTSSLNNSAVSRPHHPQCLPATYGKAAARRPRPLPLPLSLSLFRLDPKLSPFPLLLHHILTSSRPCPPEPLHSLLPTPLFRHCCR
jgi:hypothetical protein